MPRSNKKANRKLSEKHADGDQIHSIASGNKENFEKKTESARKPWELWLSIGNLLLTTIIGTWFALYLQKTEQKFQIDAQQKEQQFQADLQSQSNEFQKQILDLQKQSEYATLKIEPSSSPNSFLISNLGPAIAKNIKIYVYLHDKNEYWSDFPQLTDLNQYKIYPTYNIQLSQDYSYQVVDSIWGENGQALAIFISNLPPGEVHDYSLNLPQINSHTWSEEAQKRVDIHMILDKEMIQTSSFSTEEYAKRVAESYDYLNIRKIAEFSVDASCGNCIGDETHCDSCIDAPSMKMYGEHGVGLVLGYITDLNEDSFEIEKDAEDYVKVKYSYLVGNLGQYQDKYPNEPIYLDLHFKVQEYGGAWAPDVKFFTWYEINQEEYINLK